MSDHHPFLGDPSADISHIDWRHGPLSPAKDDAMSEEQFKILIDRLDGIAEGQKALADMIGRLHQVPANTLDKPAAPPKAADEPKVAESAPKVTPLKPKAKAHPKS